MTFEVFAGGRRKLTRDQYLVALYYKQEVFRKADDSKIPRSTGYFIYDRELIVYNSYCVPRTTCVTAEGPAGDTMTLVASKRGIAESEYMTDNATTTGFTMNISIADDTLTYSQTTGLEIYDNAFAHRFKHSS
ncbi:hypothetical protein O9993_00345 [Vibrio lentus]|nr:hypothetical protein [Vibrio lentus]